MVRKKPIRRVARHETYIAQATTRKELDSYIASILARYPPGGYGTVVSRHDNGLCARIAHSTSAD